MKKITPATLLIVGLLMACGGPPAPATPTPEPATAAPEAEEPATEEPEAAEPAEPEGEEPASVESALPPLEPARPPCHTLEKSGCSVTQGCAWFEQAGKGKCQDE